MREILKWKIWHLNALSVIVVLLIAGFIVQLIVSQNNNKAQMKKMDDVVALTNSLVSLESQKAIYVKTTAKDILSKSFQDSVTAYRIASAIWDIPIQQFGIDGGFFRAIMEQESSYDPLAKNPNSSASGLMGLLKSTAMSMAIILHKDNYDVFNIEDNILLGSQYVSILIKSHDGDLKGVLQEYGPDLSNIKDKNKKPRNYIKEVMDKISFWK